MKYQHALWTTEEASQEREQLKCATVGGVGKKKTTQALESDRSELGVWVHHLPSFCPQSLPASGTFPMSHLFTSDEIFFLSLCLFPPEIRDSWVLSSLIRCVVKIIS